METVSTGYEREGAVVGKRLESVKRWKEEEGEIEESDFAMLTAMPCPNLITRE